VRSKPTTRLARIWNWKKHSRRMCRRSWRWPGSGQAVQLNRSAATAAQATGGTKPMSGPYRALRQLG